MEFLVGIVEWIVGTPSETSSYWKKAPVNPFSNELYSVESRLDGWVKIRSLEDDYTFAMPFRKFRRKFRRV